MNSLPHLLTEAMTSDKGEALVLTDLDGAVLFWNEGAEVLYGLPASRMLGRPLSDRLGAHSSELPGWQHARTTGKYASDVLDCRVDGSLVWTHTRANLVCDAAGNPLCVKIVASDISYRRAVEERLHLLASAVTHAGEGIILTGVEVTSAEGPTIVYVNPAFCLITGYFAEEVLGKTLSLLGGNAGGEELPSLVEAIRGRRTDSFEMTCLRKDGKAYTARLDLHPVRDREGEVTHQLILLRDISEALRVEQNLRESEERFRTLTSMSPDIISIFDSEGRLVFNSAVAGKIHGYAAGELLGRSTFDLIHPEDRDHVSAAFAKLLAEPEKQAVVRYRYRNADGSYVWMEASARNELANPHIKGVIAISRDITDRVKNELTLKDDERRYRTLFAGNPNSMMIVDRETLRFLEVNDMALILYGYTREEFLQLTVRDIRPPEEWANRVKAIYDRIDEYIDRGKYPGTLIHRKKSGVDIYVDVVVQRIDWMGRRAFAFMVHDVTERTRIEAQMLQTQKLESLGLLAGGIAHDFNNLLTTIMGQASMLAVDLPENSPLRDNVQLIREASRHAAELCRQMLAYSGRGRFMVRHVSLAAHIRSCAELLQVSIGRDRELVINLDEDVPAIEADPSQIQQVLMNLVINASEAIGEKRGRITIHVSRRHLDQAELAKMHLSENVYPGAFVVLSVADTGSGMPPETLAKIFDPFFTTKFVGRGLGLAAVHGIMRGHGGAIQVQSREGEGTVFNLLFPALENAKLAVPAVALDAANTGTVKAGLILVVDDDPSVRYTARRMLERQGVKVLLAVDGEQGVRMFAEHKGRIDAVLLDLTMPRLSGDQAAREIRKIDPGARIIVMSGYDEKAESQKLDGIGHLGFLQKPFTLEMLTSTLGTALRDITAG